MLTNRHNWKNVSCNSWIIQCHIEGELMMIVLYIRIIFNELFDFKIESVIFICSRSVFTLISAIIGLRTNKSFCFSDSSCGSCIILVITACIYVSIGGK